MSCVTTELLIRSDAMRPDDQGSAASAQETHIRWGEASAFVRRRLQYELPSSSHGLIDDLVQECMVRMLRFVRRERVLNLEALLTEMARRTAIDALRRRTRWSALVTSDDEAVAALPDPHARADEPGDPLERLQFVIRAHDSQGVRDVLSDLDIGYQPTPQRGETA